MQWGEPYFNNIIFFFNKIIVRYKNNCLLKEDFVLGKISDENPNPAEGCILCGRDSHSGLQELADLPLSKLWVFDLGDVAANSRCHVRTEAVCHYMSEREFRGLYSLELVCQNEKCEQAAQEAWARARALFGA